MTKLEFRREIAMTYLTRYKTPVKSVGPTAHSSKRTSRVLDDIQYDRKDYLLSEVENKKREEDVQMKDAKALSHLCVKCDVGLCLKCNVPFHTM